MGYGHVKNHHHNQSKDMALHVLCIYYILTHSLIPTWSRIPPNTLVQSVLFFDTQSEGLLQKNFNTNHKNSDIAYAKHLKTSVFRECHPRFRKSLLVHEEIRQLYIYIQQISLTYELTSLLPFAILAAWPNWACCKSALIASISFLIWLISDS